MKKIFKTLSAVFASALIFSACTKDVQDTSHNEISEEILAKIASHGFGTKEVHIHEDGYLVEGDIILTNEFLNSAPSGKVLRIANTEQYRTTNLVTTNGSRTVTLSMDSKLKSLAGYTNALEEMKNRYNARGLLITFDIVSSGGNIHFVNANGPYLASAGFPSNGNPYSQVKVYSRNIGTGTTKTFIDYLATIFAHEVGHCIGFRHTDFYNRSLSCGGSPSNEGASTVGAIHIPGTPTLNETVDGGSFMLACISRNQNRPFSSYDQIALDYLYKQK